MSWRRMALPGPRGHEETFSDPTLELFDAGGRTTHPRSRTGREDRNDESKFRGRIDSMHSLGQRCAASFHSSNTSRSKEGVGPACGSGVGLSRVGPLLARNVVGRPWAPGAALEPTAPSLAPYPALLGAAGLGAGRRDVAPARGVSSAQRLTSLHADETCRGVCVTLPNEPANTKQFKKKFNYCLVFNCLPTSSIWSDITRATFSGILQHIFGIIETLWNIISNYHLRYYRTVCRVF